jgi:hypothetical protein
MLTYAQRRMELVTILLYTQVFIAFFAIQALFRLYQGRILLYTQTFFSL